MCKSTVVKMSLAPGVFGGINCSDWLECEVRGDRVAGLGRGEPLRCLQSHLKAVQNHCGVWGGSPVPTGSYPFPSLNLDFQSREAVGQLFCRGCVSPSAPSLPPLARWLLSLVPSIPGQK